MKSSNQGELTIALYHLSVKMISRRKLNTVRAVAYRAGCNLKNSQTGETFFFSKKEVAHIELLFPEKAPHWIFKIQSLMRSDRQAGVQSFVDCVEAAEKRINSCIWREIEVSLPQELSYEQNIALTKEFVKDQLCARGMVALLNFHFDKDEKTGRENPHCHILLTTRSLEESGFIRKIKEWNTKALLCEIREQWAVYTNFYLKSHGHEVRVDHRSYVERGIDIEPQPYKSRSVIEQEKRKQLNECSRTAREKIQEFKNAQIRNLYRLLRRPEIAFEIASKHQATFMWGDVQKVCARYIQDRELFHKMETRLKSSKELVLLSPRNEFYEDIYTTQTHLKAEKFLIETVEALSLTSHSVQEKYLKKTLYNAHQKLKEAGHSSGLSQDQKKAISHLTSPGQFKCAVGIAGSGKSTTLGICRQIWEEQGYKIYGIAPTGKASQNLSETGIDSMTLHKFLKIFEKERYAYTSRNIFVLDEAGMVDVEKFSKLLSLVKTLNAKLIAVGDPAQFHPVGAGPAFRIITERTEKSHLITVLRQKEGWQREATSLFGKQKTEEALTMYQERGYLQFIKEPLPSFDKALSQEDPKALHQLHALAAFVTPRLYRMIKEDKSQTLMQHPDYLLYLKWMSVKKATGSYGKNLSQNQKVDPRSHTKEVLLESWHKDFQNTPEKSFLILALTHKDVHDLNKEARTLLKKSGYLSEKDIFYKISKEAEDDFGKRRALFTSKAFSKGEHIVFTRNHYGLKVRNGTVGTIIKLNKTLITVKLHAEDRELSFSPNLHPFFDQGWALTIHKSQGITTDKTYILASSSMTQNMTYVAMTRHRESVSVFGSSLEFFRPEKMSKILSQSGEKLAAQDYLSKESLEKLIREEDKVFKKIFIRLSDELEAMGAVSRQAFWKVIDQFLGRNPDKIVVSKFHSQCVSEEKRSQKILKRFWKKVSSFEKETSPFRNEKKEIFNLKALETYSLEKISKVIEETFSRTKNSENKMVSSKAQGELETIVRSLQKSENLFKRLENFTPHLMQNIEEALREKGRKVGDTLDKGRDVER